GISACYQFFVDLLKQLDREDLNQLWALMKEYLSIRPVTNDKEMELWVELKMQTPGSGISILLAVGTPSTDSGKLYCHKVGPTACPIVTRRKGKEVMVESDTPKKKKLQEQIGAQVARELEEQQKRGQSTEKAYDQEAEEGILYGYDQKQLRVEGKRFQRLRVSLQFLLGPYKPTTVLVHAVKATDDSPAVPEHMTSEWSRFVTIVKQQHKLDEVSYHKLFDILKQYQNEVNELRTEKLARNANPLALVATAQASQDPHYQSPRSHRSSAPSPKPSIPSRSQTTTKHKGKEIAKPITPPSEIASEEDNDPEQA
nr:hypothetical protein [Tanacetum cinerariifolium]